MGQRGWALVTGSSHGIGRALAQRLGADGFDVAVNYRKDKEGAETTAELVRAAGSQAIIVSADVGDSREVGAMFDEIAKQTGPLTALINNAGVQTFKSLIDLEESDWDRTIRTNLKGTFLCTQQAARRMRDAGSRGSIVNIGSGSNQTPFPNLVDYTASKGGIEMLTKVAAVELGRYGIRVNCVAPGAIENERTNEEDPTYAETWANITPLGRVGTMTDVADAVSLMLSEQAGFITGQTVFVDGGLWTRGQWPYDF